MKKWYVLKTKPHREDTVKRLMTNALYTVFLPKIKEFRTINKAQQITLKSLFPSYLFLNIDFDSGKNFHLIKYTRGVAKILCSGNKPQAIPENIIQTIKKHANDEGLIVKPIKLFKAGDKIKVRKGILKDLTGIIERPTNDEERVFVLLNLLNYKLSANLHWAEIEKMT